MVIFVNEKSLALKFMTRIIFPLLFLFLLPTVVSAQASLNKEQQNMLFQEALGLVNRSNYSAARLKFEEYIQTGPSSEMLAEARYYQAFSAMQLFHEDAEKLYENFVRDYPIHPKAMLAFFELGNFYYRNKNYDNAIDSYEQVKVNNLSNAQRSELRFKLGYSYFAEKKFDEALKNLNYSIENQNTYQGASAYYSAYIALENEQFADALRFLDIAANYETYDRVVPFLKTKALYGQKKYNEVIAYARPLLIVG
jgi:TolA-binding protein